MAFRFLFRMHYKRLLFFAVFITVAFVLLRQLHRTQSAPAHERPKLRVASRRQGEPAAVIELDVDQQQQQQQQEHDEYGTYHRLDRVGEALSRVSTCPACYGRELCSEFSEGYVTIDTAHPSMRGGRVLYSGFRHGSYQVTVTTLAESEYRAFDRVLCENAGLQENCDPASAALRSYVARPEAFTVTALRNAYKTFHTSAHTHTPQVCISDSLIRKLIAVYDENEDEKFNENEMANLYTTLITSPETAILKLLSKERSVWALPSHMGTCGRMSVVEGGLRPLADFVDERWEVRADLASQILQMIDDFQHTDNRWFFMFSELTYDHLAVTSDNRVLLTDIGDGHLIDKHGDVLHGKSLQGVCNEECFARYTRKLGGGGGEGELDVACARMPLYGHLMYAVACQEVLLPEDDAHRHQNFFGATATLEQSRKAGAKGLLHSVPEKDAGRVGELLQECVEETGAGGRLQAIEELDEILIKYTSDDVDEEEDAEDDEDEDADEVEDEEEEMEADGDVGEEASEQDKEAVEESKEKDSAHDYPGDFA